MTETYSVNKAVNLIFDTDAETSTGTTTANINISFPVKEMYIRQIVVTTDDIDGTDGYVILYSDIVGASNVIGNFYIKSESISNNMQNIRYIFKEPITVNGTYTFQLKYTSGLPASLVQGKLYTVCVIMEFVRG